MKSYFPTYLLTKVVGGDDDSWRSKTRFFPFLRTSDHHEMPIHSGWGTKESEIKSVDTSASSTKEAKRDGRSTPVTEDQNRSI